MKKFDLPIKVEVLIYKKNEDGPGQFLAVKRSLEDGGFWQPITGTLESSESLGSCILREMYEETSIGSGQVVSISDCLHSFSWDKKGTGKIYEYVFVVEVKNDSIITLSKEHTEYKWCSKEEAIERFPMEENKIALKKVDIL